MRHVTPHFDRRLVLAQPLIDGLTQKIVFRPGKELTSATKLGPHPMQRGSEPAASRNGIAFGSASDVLVARSEVAARCPVMALCDVRN